MSTLNQEWLNQNALRAYPLAEDTQRRPSRVPSAFVVPDCLLVDFVVALVGGADAAVHLAALTKTGEFMSMVWADGSGGVIGSVTAATSTHAPNTAYPLVMTEAYEDATGWAVVGDLASALSVIPDGAWSFAPESARMETATIRPSIRGVRALRVVNDGDTSAWMSGHITLVAGQNIVLTPDTVAKSVRIDARVTAGLNEECTCTRETRPQPIRRINGVNIEDLQIVGDGKCIDVRTAGSVITLVDTCSKPCCGCPELDELGRIMGLAEASLTRLEAYAETLAAKQGEFTAKLGTTMR